MNIEILYVTFPNEKEAMDMANSLLEKKLIICANLLSPITSVYKWEGTIETSKEFVQLFKTRTEKIREAEKHISKNHSYDAPAILKINSSSLNDSYSKWAAIQ